MRGGGNKSPSPGAAFRPTLQTKLRQLSKLPTPTACDANRGVDSTKARRQARGWTAGDTLNDALRRLATPTAHDSQGLGFNDTNLANQVGGIPHPAFHCWMMGFPLLWTQCDARATQSFHLWLRTHSASFGDDFTEDGDE